MSNPASAKLDFGKSERAFIKAYANGLSGTRKFVLLVAYAAKGQVDKEVELLSPGLKKAEEIMKSTS